MEEWTNPNQFKQRKVAGLDSEHLDPQINFKRFGDKKKPPWS